MTIRTNLLHGLLLAVGMFLYFKIAMSAYLHFANHSIFFWIGGLAIIGFFIRRWFWRQRSEAWMITGTGFSIFVFILLGSAPFFVEIHETIVQVLEGAFHSLIFLYFPWFWLPFAIGVLAGSFGRGIQALDEPENAAEHPPASDS